MCLLWGTNRVFISRKTAFFIVTAVITSNFTQCIDLFHMFATRGRSVLKQPQNFPSYDTDLTVATDTQTASTCHKLPFIFPNKWSNRLRGFHNAVLMGGGQTIISSIFLFSFANEVAQLLRHCATSRKVAGSRGYVVNGFFIYLILLAALGPEVYSAFNWNENQKRVNDISGE
jgi:hypothetical protein